MTHELVGPPVSRAGPSISGGAPGVIPRVGNKKNGVLSRIGQGLIAFGANRTASSIRRERSGADIASNQADITANTAELGRQQIESNQAATLRDQELQQLIGVVQSGNTEQSRQAADRVFQLNPELADTLFKNMGATSAAQREDASRRASEILQTAPEGREAVILEQAEALRADGRDPAETLSLIGQSPDNQDRALNIIQSAALSTQQRLRAGGGGPTIETRTSAARAAVGEFTPEEIRQQARIDAGILPRASLSATERIALDEKLAALVASSQADIREAGKFAELTGAARAKVIDTGFKSIEKIDANIRNLDRAIEALDAGANTGAIFARFSPTVREASVQLAQVQSALGLDVVGAVSFGALSEGELNLALAVALPTRLDEPALRQWILDRQAAQTKLRGYLEKQIDFLDQGGTPAGFLRQQRRDAGETQPVSTEAPTDTSQVTQADLDNMSPEDRALFAPEE